MTSTAVRDRMDATLIDVPPGLANVVVAETELGDVRGLEGFYHYREYSAPELARSRSVEDVWRLLLDGSLPDPDQAAAFADEVRPRRPLPAEIGSVVPAIAAATAHADPLAGLRAVLPLLAGVSAIRPLYD